MQLPQKGPPICHHYSMQHQLKTESLPPNIINPHPQPHHPHHHPHPPRHYHHHRASLDHPGATKQGKAHRDVAWQRLGKRSLLLLSYFLGLRFSFFFAHCLFAILPFPFSLPFFLSPGAPPSDPAPPFPTPPLAAQGTRGIETSSGEPTFNYSEVITIIGVSTIITISTHIETSSGEPVFKFNTITLRSTLGQKTWHGQKVAMQMTMYSS